MPAISVIIPAYNAEATIAQTIASVQKQTFTDLEIIVVNDGSTDRTLEVLQQISDPRLKVFSYENSGVSVSRNRGIAQATGQYIALLDSDDLWTPDKLESQLTALQQNSKAGVAYSWTYFMFENEKLSFVENSHYCEGNVYADLLLANFLHSGSNPLIRKEAVESIGLFDPAIKSVEDWDYYIRLAKKWDFVLVPKPQILYRQHLSSISYNIEVMQQHCLELMEKTFATAPLELQHLKGKSLANIYQYSAQKYRKTFEQNPDNLHYAAHKLWLSIRSYPQVLLTKHTQSLLIWILKKIVYKQLGFVH